jgi:acyl-CoA thioester hydrolase
MRSTAVPFRPAIARHCVARLQAQDPICWRSEGTCCLAGARAVLDRFGTGAGVALFPQELPGGYTKVFAMAKYVHTSRYNGKRISMSCESKGGHWLCVRACEKKTSSQFSNAEATDIMDQEIKLTDYTFQAYDKLRYGDTDRQGHINNAVFTTLLETGRVEFFREMAAPLADAGSNFVIARLVLDFKREIRWPGTVSIGTRVASVGRSSIRLEQALFQNERCVAVAESVVVLMDETTRRSRPLSAAAVEGLSALGSKQVK